MAAMGGVTAPGAKLELRVVTDVTETLRRGVHCVNEFAFCAHLGAGSFATVALAREVGPHSTALRAIKCFSKSRLLKKRTMTRTDDGGMLVETALDQVQREILLMRRLGPHPHIMTFRAVLSSLRSDSLYYVMDYADAGVAMTYTDPPPATDDGGDDAPFAGLDLGGDGGGAGSGGGHRQTGRFDCRLPGGGPFPLATVAHLTAQLLTAVAHAHALGVAHRDIKPENCLLASDGTLLLSDFGVGRAFDPDDEDGDGSGGGAGVDTTAVPSGSSHPGAGSLVQRRLSPASLAMSAAVLASPRGPLASSYHVPAALPPPTPPDGGSGGVGDDDEGGPSAAAAGAVRLPLDWVTDTAGSFLFLAPEACSGDGGYRAMPADVWAVGVTAYVLACGVSPFGATAASTMEMFDSICNDPLTWPVAHAANPASPAADPLLRSFISALLDRDPATRPTARQALRHPFLAPCFDTDTGELAPCPSAIPPLSLSRLTPYLSPAAAGAGVDGDAVRPLLAALLAGDPPPAVVLGMSSDADVLASGPPDAGGGGGSPPLRGSHDPGRLSTASAGSGGGGGGGGGGAGLPTSPSPLSTATSHDSTGRSSGGFDMPLVRSGWLWKRGRVLKTWKRRWFELRGDDLRYFKAAPTEGTPPSRGGGSGGAGCFHIGSIVTATPATKPDKPHRFYVATPGRTLYLQADTAADMTEWIAVFKVLQTGLLRPESAGGAAGGGGRGAGVR